MASFKLKLKTLPFGSTVINGELDGAFFNDMGPSEVRQACAKATLAVTRKGDNDYHVEIACKGTVTVACDRCLDDLTLPVEASYDLNLKQQGHELDDSTDGLLIVPDQWREVDLAPLVRDTVLLAIPASHSHAPGDCDSAMMELLEQHRAVIAPDDESAADREADEEREDNKDDSAASTDPRWDALKKLKNNNN